MMKPRFQHASWLRSTFVAVSAALLVFMAFLLEAQALRADQQTSPDKKEAEPKKGKAARMKSRSSSWELAAIFIT